MQFVIVVASAVLASRRNLKRDAFFVASAVFVSRRNLKRDSKDCCMVSQFIVEGMQ